MDLGIKKYDRSVVLKYFTMKVFFVFIIFNL